MPIPDHTVPAAVEPVRKSVVVRRPQAAVFALFTDRLDTWWPLATHSIAADSGSCSPPAQNATTPARRRAALRR